MAWKTSLFYKTTLITVKGLLLFFKVWDFDKLWEKDYGYDFEKQANCSEIWPEQGNLASSF